jgi:tetratricopeptide (TPR) repeat protein
VAKKADKALDKLQGMLKADPKNFFAYNLLGEVYSRTNKFSDAINAYKQAISIKPAWATPYRNIAAINILQKQKNDAIDILSKGINSANEPLELVGELATLYHQDGAHQKVIELYEEIYKKNPDSLPMLNNLVRYMVDYMNSAEALSRAANLAQPLATTNDPYMLDTVAWIAYKQGRYEKSRELLLKVNGLNPNLAVSQYHLGMVYFKLGDKLQAKEYLQNAINKKENFNGLADAKEALQQLVKSSK